MGLFQYLYNVNVRLVIAKTVLSFGWGWAGLISLLIELDSGVYMCLYVFEM